MIGLSQSAVATLHRGIEQVSNSGLYIGYRERVQNVNQGPAKSDSDKSILRSYPRSSLKLSCS